MGDSQQTFYMVLTVAIALFTIFLCVTLVYLILILRDVSKMLEKTRDTVDKVNSFVMKPVALAASIVEHIRPFIEGVVAARFGEEDDEDDEPRHKRRHRS